MSKGKFGEPWAFRMESVYPQSPKIAEIKTADGNRAFDVDVGDFCGFSKGKADRIVACVNACASIPDPVEAVERARESLHNAIALWGHLSTDETQQLWLAQARAALAALGDGQ